MKVKLMPVLSVFFFASASLWAAGFEGVVEYKISETGGAAQRMTYAIRGKRARITMDGVKQNGVVLLDSGTDAIFYLNADKKMAVKSDLRSDASSVPKRKSSKKVEFSRTGKRLVVAGRDCEIFTFSDESSEGTACMAQDMGKFLFMRGGGPGGGRTQSIWEKEAVDKEFFPLKITSKNIHSGKTMMMEAVKIDQRRLEPSEFEVPADYKVMEGFGTGAKGKFDPDEFRKKMMNASPEERKRLAEEMRKAYSPEN